MPSPVHLRSRVRLRHGVMRLRTLLTPITVALMCAAGLAQSGSHGPKRIVVMPGAIVDVKSGELITGKAILVEGGRIARIASAPVPAEAGDELIDLRSYTVLPGL